MGGGTFISLRKCYCVLRLICVLVNKSGDAYVELCKEDLGKYSCHVGCGIHLKPLMLRQIVGKTAEGIRCQLRFVSVEKYLFKIVATYC